MESHSIKIHFKPNGSSNNGKVYSIVNNLEGGQITETNGEDTITYNVEKRVVTASEAEDGQKTGTFYEFSNFRFNGEIMNGDAVFVTATPNLRSRLKAASRMPEKTVLR